MGCAICGQMRTENELMIFSYAAYTQIISILKKVTRNIDEALKAQKDLAVHVCRECMQDSVLI